MVGEVLQLQRQQRAAAADDVVHRSVPDVGVPVAAAEATSAAVEVGSSANGTDAIDATPAVTVGTEPSTGARRDADELCTTSVASVNSGRFVHGKDPRRRQQEPRLASSKEARAVAHSRGTGQLCKAAVDGAIRGQGAFVIISFSQAGNVNFFSTSEDAGISTDDWMDPELQRWLQSRANGSPFATAAGHATHGGFSASSGILGRSGDESYGQQRQYKRQRIGHVSSAVESISAQP